MYWILATLFVVIALAVPRLRPIGVAGLVVLGALLAWGMVQRLRGIDGDDGQPRTVAPRGRPSSPAAVLQPVPLSAVVAEDLKLSGGGAPFELRGRITNQSADMLLKSVTIRLTRRDCYAGALDSSGCARLWQDEHWVALAVPPRESRNFVVSIWMRGEAPRPRGTLQDSFEVIAAAGELRPGGQP